MNNTTDLEQEFNFNSQQHKTKRIVFLSIVALATYFGNILILITLRKFSTRLKGTPFILIGNLAVSDLLLAIGLTFQLVEYIVTPLESNVYSCVTKLCFLSVSLMASGKLLLFMSLDRFCAIVFPMKHFILSKKATRRRVKIILIWMESLLVGCVPVIVKANSTQVITCGLGELVPREVTLVASVFIPLESVVSVVLCLIVIWRLRTNPMSRQKYKKSMIKCGLLIKIYIAFAVCWAPFVVTTILIETTNQKQKFMTIREYAVIPGFFNSAMNWVIYGLANNKLRNAFKHTLLCRNLIGTQASKYSQRNSSEDTTCNKPTEKQILETST